MSADHRPIRARAAALIGPGQADLLTAGPSVGERPAPVFARCAAWLLDVSPFVAAGLWLHDRLNVWTCVVGGWTFVQDAFLSARSGQTSPQLDLSIVASLVLFLGAVLALNVLWALYRVACLPLCGATAGKLMFGLRVVSVPDGGRPSWQQAWIRWAVPQGLALIPLPGTGLAPYVMAVRDRELGRGGHDRLSRTCVVRAPGKATVSAAG